MIEKRMIDPEWCTPPENNLCEICGSELVIEEDAFVYELVDGVVTKIEISVVSEPVYYARSSIDKNNYRVCPRCLNDETKQLSKTSGGGSQSIEGL